MKAFKVIILSLLILSTTISIAEAQTPIGVKVQDGSGVVGSSVTVSVAVDQALNVQTAQGAGLGSASLRVLYNQSVLTVTSATSTLTNAVINSATPGEIRLASATTGGDVLAAGAPLLTMAFSIASTALPGTTILTLAHADLTDTSVPPQTIATTLIDGTITILPYRQPPHQPSNISPAEGASRLSLIPTLQSSAFFDPDSGDTHAASQWQITTTSGDYSSPVFDSGKDNSNLTSIAIRSGVLGYSTTYYWRVRHQDSHGAWSGWSEETSFTTIEAPAVGIGWWMWLVIIIFVCGVVGGILYIRHRRHRKSVGR